MKNKIKTGEIRDSFDYITIDSDGIFKIDYSASKNKEACTFIRSPTFISEGRTWVIRYSPKGSNIEDNGTYVSLNLELQSKGKFLCTNFSFRLLHNNGYWSTTLLPVDSAWRRSTCIFRGINCYHGFRAFIERSVLEAQYVRDGFFFLSCDIKVMNEAWEKPPLSHKVGLPAFKFLHDDFNELLTKKEMTDVSFAVDGEIFVAHRLVLAARSPVFKAELFGSMAEANMKCIKINDMSALVFKVLLHFMYTDSLPKVAELFDGECGEKNTDLYILAQHLMVAADRYRLEGLKEICEEKLCMGLTLETVVTSLSLANQLNCHRLKDICLEFVTMPENFVHLAITDPYVQLMQSCPSLLADLRSRFNNTSSSDAALKRQKIE
ncbi:BTB/POZ and MATH domain-containing protein 1-like isoform X1 [Carex littledalei]|uniref:BTB/POZ and MATH domain-containing protein 1-like isoform X1 n=1 Tax=Carex littledalei TaxID=544730 RepID=A0A833R6V1_9POAL|nr:BTB/POZ and MATH domain-containing protein 1-like isoform X1 [Carex littledalei]